MIPEMFLPGTGKDMLANLYLLARQVVILIIASRKNFNVAKDT